MIKKVIKKWSTNEIKNGQKNVQKSDQKVTTKIDEKSPDSYHKELPKVLLYLNSQVCIM